ncbi:MAG: histidine--tRNA ligase [Kiloniellaceae bacterium]
MSALQPVRGTRDILPEEMRRHRAVQEVAREMAARYGYAEIATPIFELTEVFARSLGATSDIVTKEMYTFQDKGGESITLRPEYTAGVARAFMSNFRARHLPLKFFCCGPMFRYERPQKGRLRQFHQIDVELLGVRQPLGDVEVIALAAHILEALGLKDRVTLELNTLGDFASRAAYRKRLVDYLGKHRDRLSAESLVRLKRNPLRIFDSKDKGDQAVVARAPLLMDSLNQESRKFFDKVCQGLEAVGVAYHVNPRLVRGLDYYCHTAFEFTTTELGAQGAVLAGGRYDGLVKSMGGGMGGPDTPATGWAAGVERLAMLIEAPKDQARPIVVVPVDDREAQERKALEVTRQLRRAGFTVELGFSGSLRKRMRHANKLAARAAVLLGEDELAQNAATVRDLESGEQELVSLDALTERLARFR